MRVGLVLGAGGIQGGAWLTGGLDALAEETGWDPASADYVVGTSAGSMIGALCASGIPPWFMVAHSRGETFEGVEDARGREAAEADRAAGAGFQLERTWPPIGPGSWRLALRTLDPAPPLHARNRRHRLAPAGGLLGRGAEGHGPERRPERLEPPPEPVDRGLRLLDRSPRRVRPRGLARRRPRRRRRRLVRDPGLYHPVTIDGRRYVDGGIYSASNADILRNEKLDLVICLNPTSTLHPIRAINPRDAFNIVFQRASGRRLGSEAKKLRSAGTEVVLIQPLHEDLQAMGPNLMRTGNRNEVIEVARHTVARQLAEPGTRELLASLPPGDPEKVRRPDGPSSEWPPLLDLQSRRAA